MWEICFFLDLLEILWNNVLEGSFNDFFYIEDKFGFVLWYIFDILIKKYFGFFSIEYK